MAIIVNFYYNHIKPLKRKSTCDLKDPNTSFCLPWESPLGFTSLIITWPIGPPFLTRVVLSVSLSYFHPRDRE